ncbi:MAG: hypothetical protein NC131_19365, partial [Roseburia sp.]|nr:hypothetical protein [Roseburia sp.]
SRSTGSWSAFADRNWNNKDVPMAVEVADASDVLKSFTYDKYLRGAVAAAMGDEFAAAAIGIGPDYGKATWKDEVYVWGANESGQLAQGYTDAAQTQGNYTGSLIAIRAKNDDSWSGEHLSQLMARGSTLTVMTEEGYGYLAGRYIGTESTDDQKLPIFITVDKYSADPDENRGLTDVQYYNSDPYDQRLDNVLSIVLGNKHGLALRDDGSIFAWGSNSNNQLGSYYNNAVADLTFADDEDLTSLNQENKDANGNPNWRTYPFRVGAEDYHALFLNNALAITNANGSTFWLTDAADTGAGNDPAEIGGNALLNQVRPTTDDGTVSDSYNGLHDSQTAHVTIHENQTLTVDLSKVTMKYNSGFLLWNELSTTDLAKSAVGVDGADPTESFESTGRTLRETGDLTGTFTVASSNNNVASARVENGKIIITTHAATSNDKSYGTANILVKWTGGVDADKSTGNNGASEYGIIALTVVPDTSKTPALGTGVKPADQVAAPQIDGGSTFAVTLRTDGTVWTWGQNNFGQLGDGSTTNRTVPVQVVTDVYGTPLTNVVSIAAGETFAMALDKDGYVWTWGNNNVGQLGIGNTSGTYSYAVRVLKGQQEEVNADSSERYLTNIKSIVAGSGHDGSSTDGDFAGAVDANGYVYTWGSNAYGQLGVARTSTSQSLPVRVLAGAASAGKNQTNYAYDGYLHNVVSLAAGEGHMLALLDNSFVVSWGRNVTTSSGDGQQLGLEYTNNTTIALPVTRGNNPAGRDAAHANESRFIRQVTDMDAGRQMTVFQTVETSANGYTKGYALITGRIKPHNYTANEYNWTRPTVITNEVISQSNKVADRSDLTKAITDVYQVAAGADDVAIMTGPKPNGTVWAMGVNTDGQLSQAYFTGQNSATRNDDTIGPVTVQAPLAQQPVDSRDPVYMTNNAAVAVGDNTLYLYQTDGTVYAVGRGTVGQLGNGEAASQNLPVQTGQGNKLSVKAAKGTLTQGTTTVTYDLLNGKGMPDFITMGVNDVLTLNAAAANIKLQQSQGFNLYRDAYYTDLPAGAIVRFELSDPTIGTFGTSVTNGAANGTEVTVRSADATKLGATDLIIKVYDSTGKLVAQGSTRITFIKKSKATNSAVATGVNHSVALAEDGTLWVWGSNVNGQLGLADAEGAYKTISYREYPAHLTIMSGASEVTFTAIAAGDTYTLAIAENGTLWGFGGGYGDENGAPAPVAGITDSIAQVAVYHGRAIALTTGGKVLTWTDGKA